MAAAIPDNSDNAAILNILNGLFLPDFYRDDSISFQLGLLCRVAQGVLLREIWEVNIMTASPTQAPGR